MVTFPEVPLGIFLFCMCVIAIGAVQVGHLGLPSPLLDMSAHMHTWGGHACCLQ